MTAAQKNQTLASTIRRRLGTQISLDDAAILRRAELTLQRWAEQECGDSNDYASWAIERDETTNRPYMVRHLHRATTNSNLPATRTTRTPIADKETATLKRVQKLTTLLGLFFYHQTDPRGASLYVSNSPLNDQNYTNGVACWV